MEFSIQNTHNDTWQSVGKRACCVGVIYPLAGSDLYIPGEWQSADRPAKLSEGTKVAPAEIATFRVPIRVPEKPGLYRETWGMLIEGRGWLPTLNALNIQIKVN
jgi:hypothetical protein